MQYDPESLNDRRALAVAVIAKLTECGFTEEAMPKTNEKVYTREVPSSPGMKVAVYTTITGQAVRAVGTDAIRVTALYMTKAGTYRGVGSDKRVNRTGEVSAIVDRMHERMRDMWKVAKSPERCHCGAAKFNSKKGNAVCADLCWKAESDKTTFTRPQRHFTRPTWV